MRRREFLLGAAAACALPVPGLAQSYPDHPVRVVVAFAAGGGTDLIGRTVAQRLQAVLGQPFVVENRGGAGGNIGTDLIAKAPADGYSLLLGYSSNFVIAPFLYDDLAYKPLKDFAPVSLVATATNILAAHPSLPVSTLKELQAYAKANPRKIYFGTAGVGTLGHLTGELYGSVAGVEIVHAPYKGNSAALTDLLAGRVQLFAGSPAVVMEFVRNGRLKGLAVASAEREPGMPEIPTFIEQGFAVEALAWFGLLAPAGTPAAVIETLNKAVVTALDDAAVKESFAKLGYAVRTSTPAAFADFIRTDYARWQKVIKAAGIKAE